MMPNLFKNRTGKRNLHAAVYIIFLFGGISLLDSNTLKDTFLNRMIFYGFMMIAGLIIIIYHRKSFKRNLLFVQLGLVLFLILLGMLYYL